MGAGESIIRNVDKRSSRREYREVFMKGIQEFRSHPQPESGPATNDVKKADQVVQVAVRKRPIFPHEIQAEEFDVVTCSTDISRITIHDARMGADMKQRFLDHHHFDFNHVFSEEHDSNQVFDTVVSPLVELVRRGGNGTALMYGQTGSGKTFTMSHCYQRASWELFKESVGSPSLGLVHLSFVELSGDTVYDILNKHNKLQLVTCPNGEVMAYPAVMVPVKTPQQLHDCIKFACSLRATAATGVHDHSSRSHAICRIELEGGNSLTLVDLAGSEHRIDSAEHDAQRRKESAKINSTLMKLKECIRARAKNATYIPYRQSRLTHLLRPSFVEDGDIESQTIIIATVSPSSKDTEHSLNTLRHACIMDGQDQQDSDKSWTTGGITERQELEPVNVTALARQAKAKRDAIRKGIVDENTGSWGSAPSKNHSRDGSFDQVSKAADLKKAEKLLLRARREAENSGMCRLSSDTKENLVAARETAGEIQRARMNALKLRDDLLQKQAKDDLKEAERRKREKERIRKVSEAALDSEASQSVLAHQRNRFDSDNNIQAGFTYQHAHTPQHYSGDHQINIGQHQHHPPSSGYDPQDFDHAGRKYPHQPQTHCHHRSAHHAPHFRDRWSEEPEESSGGPQIIHHPNPPSKRETVQQNGSLSTLTWPEMKEDIRRRVWCDPRIPDDEKEEQIVAICKSMKARLVATQQQNSEVQSRKEGAHNLVKTEEQNHHVDRVEVDRHEQARIAREKQIAEEQRRKQEKLYAKQIKQTPASNNFSELQSEILRIEQEIHGEQDRMKLYGLKQQLARTKATLLRASRKKPEVVDRMQTIDS